ncbi:sensor histidine kinase [Methyloligella halotolerans]|uniref:sensor histidine kinase n=1 Tax=Methyloligella halotolerans TaxID=1177755 RepID=UPI00083DC8C2|nr:PAS domain-containing sensor histidine kinase [Methyloligella halotolerans]
MLLSSSALAAVSTRAAAQELGGSAAGLDIRLLLILGTMLGVMAFAIGTALYAMRTTRQSRARAEAAINEAETLRSRKMRLESILAAEPQLLFAWTEAQAPKLLIANLPQSLGVPSAADAFMRFSEWLSEDGVDSLKAAIASLTETGQGFNLMLATLAGKHIEIDGRAAGPCVTLKVRDITGQRLDMARVGDRHRLLDAQIGALKSLLDTLPEPAWLRGPDRNLTWVNQAYADATDANAATRVVQEQIDILPPNDRKAAEKSLARAGEFREQILVSTSRGAQRYSAQVVGRGGVSAGMAREIAAERKPQASADGRLRGFDRMATAFAVFDSEQRLVHFNQAYADLWKLDAAWLADGPFDAEILDKLRFARQLPEKADYRDWKQGWLAVYGRDAQFDDEWHLPDGRALHVVIDSVPGRGVTYLYEDVTERFALESRYNELIQVQRETIDTLREGVAVFSQDGALRLYNKAFASIWRLNPRQLDGEPHIDEVIESCRVLHDDQEEWARTKVAVTAITSERYPYESQFDRDDGCVIAAAALPLPDGGTLLTYVDVSDSVRAERALIEKNEALETADRLKTTFIRHVSYELRTPLTNIVGFTDFLLDVARDPLSDKQAEYLNDIRSSGRTLRTIIDDILDLASIDAGALHLEKDGVDVRKVIASLESGLAGQMQQNGVKLAVEIGEAVDRVTADRQRLSQILYNLLSNAVSFSPNGGTVMLNCDDDDGMIRFRVKDEGPGIPAEMQESIFEPFESRASGAGRRGAGLGLAIVKSLVELHGGHIALRTGTDRGTEFQVWLPRAPQDTSDAAGSGRHSSLAG